MNYQRIHKSPPPVPVLSQINPSTRSQLISLRYTLILSSHLQLGFPNSLIPSYFPHETQYAPLLFPIRSTCPAYLIFHLITPTLVLHSPLISSYLFRLPEKYLINSPKYEAPHYAVFSSILSLPPSLYS